MQAIRRGALRLLPRARVPTVFHHPTWNLQHQGYNRHFASLADAVRETKKPRPLINVRKQLWEFYLSTGRGANALFEAIDIDENGSVEPKELKEFMIDVLVDVDGEPIDPQELMPYAWNRLEQREAAGQSYDMKVRF